MSDLAELLELLHGAGTRWRTVRLEMRRWGNSELSGDAMHRHADGRVASGQSGGAVFGMRSGRPGPSTWEMTTRAWVDQSADRTRVETSGNHADRLTIRDGRLWWSFTPQSGSISNETEPEIHGGSGGEFDWMLEPSSLLPSFDFTPTGTTEVADRRAVTAVAVPRPPDPRHGHGAHFANGADDVLLAVDIERGVVLRAEARIATEPFALFEMIELAFDDDLPDDLFHFVSPDGSAVHSPRSAFAQPEPMSVEEAARRASFTVLVPTRLPRGWTLDASYSGPSERPPRKETVGIRVLEVRHESPRMQFQEASEPFQDMLEWEVVERGGHLISVVANVARSGGIEAKLQIGGTHVRASGTLEREVFLEIVASLAPAPTEIPPMLDQ